MRNQTLSSKMAANIGKTGRRFFCGWEQGVSLIEVLVALGIFAAVGVVFLLGLTTSSKAVMSSQERVSAESLAKSQIESIRSQAYDAVDEPAQYSRVTDIPAGYNVIITATRLDPKNDGSGNDDGLQQITVTVMHDGETAFTLIDYKVNR
jgi:Tfp pilus assembly protein PilV